jgi:hypothetical protein
VNRKPTRQSTTATPSSGKYIGSIIAVVLGLLPTTSVFTLPPSIHAYGHSDMGVIIGMAPALATLIVVVSLCTCYLLMNLLAVLATIGRLVLGRDAAATSIADLMGTVVNPLISLITLTPYKAPRPGAASTKRLAAGESLLPAVPIAARTEVEALYWELKREREDKPEPEPVSVPAAEPVTEPSHGKHAKPEDAEASATEAEPAVKVAA